MQGDFSWLLSFSPSRAAPSGSTFFKLYDEKWRINAYFQDFKRLRFPAPEAYYHD
jgi:hypothetical protein